MPIYLGNKKITMPNISKVYLGEDLVYTSFIPTAYKLYFNINVSNIKITVKRTSSKYGGALGILVPDESVNNSVIYTLFEEDVITYQVSPSTSSKNIITLKLNGTDVSNFVNTYTNTKTLTITQDNTITVEESSMIWHTIYTNESGFKVYDNHVVNTSSTGVKSNTGTSYDIIPTTKWWAANKANAKIRVTFKQGVGISMQKVTTINPSPSTVSFTSKLEIYNISGASGTTATYIATKGTSPFSLHLTNSISNTGQIASVRFNDWCMSGTTAFKLDWNALYGTIKQGVAYYTNSIFELYITKIEQYY